MEKNTLANMWRPMMGWTYMITCLFDFIIGPIVYNMLQFMSSHQHIEMWQAITLQGGGLYHLSMGAVLGITAYGRTQEKLNGAAEHIIRVPEPVSSHEPIQTSFGPGPAPQVDEPR